MRIPWHALGLPHKMAKRGPVYFFHRMPSIAVRVVRFNRPASMKETHTIDAYLVVLGLIWLIGLLVLVWRRRQLWGTTLLAPWAWSVVSLLTVGTAELLIGLDGSLSPNGWSAPLRFIAATSTFCPIVALLGAKRPQNSAWQFIVLSLWVILGLPGFEGLLFGEVYEIHPARCWFLAILVGIGLLNGIATRYWPSSVLFGAGQLALIAPYFPPTPPLFSAAAAPLWGLGFLTASWGLLALDLPRPKRSETPWDRAWLDFRDAYGAVWSLRIAERINATAVACQSPVVLGWRGFRGRDASSVIAELPQPAADTLRALLPRFVSCQWIDARLGALAQRDCERIPIQASEHVPPRKRASR